MDWPRFLADPPATFAVRYRVGTRKAPDGETVLVVGASGDVRVDNWKSSFGRAWTGKVDRSVVRAIVAAMQEAGFPEVPSHTIPPGSGIAALSIDGVSGQEPALFNVAFVRDRPAWRALLAKLESLAAAATAGELYPAVDRTSTAVADQRAVT